MHIHKVVLRLPDSWSNWNLEMLVFEERAKPEYPEKNLSEQRREPTSPRTNSTHIITDNQVTLFLHDRTLSRKLFSNVHVKCGFRFGTSNGIYRLHTLCAICYKNGNYATIVYFFVTQWEVESIIEEFMDIFVPVFGFICRSLVWNRQQILILSNDQLRSLLSGVKFLVCIMLLKKSVKRG